MSFVSLYKFEIKYLGIPQKVPFWVNSLIVCNIELFLKCNDLRPHQSFGYKKANWFCNNINKINTSHPCRRTISMSGILY
jgi:hypothetical protein